MTWVQLEDALLAVTPSQASSFIHSFIRALTHELTPSFKHKHIQHSEAGIRVTIVLVVLGRGELGDTAALAHKALLVVVLSARVDGARGDGQIAHLTSLCEACE